MWNVGTLQPGDEVTVSLQIMPLAEGEIGSVAQVVFQAHAAARTLVHQAAAERDAHRARKRC